MYIYIYIYTYVCIYIHTYVYNAMPGLCPGQVRLAGSTCFEEFFQITCYMQEEMSCWGRNCAVHMYIYIYINICIYIYT